MKSLLALPLVLMLAACSCNCGPTPEERYETALSIWTMHYNDFNQNVRRLYEPGSADYKKSQARLQQAIARVHQAESELD